MSNTAWDMYQAMMKQSADALVPGQVGMGMTPGVTGMLDSDPMTASNSAIAAQRAAMQEAALIHPSADAGAGYSHPAPATSPSLQMAADVKAAAVIDEAIKFAEQVYLMNKQANDLNNEDWLQYAKDDPTMWQRFKQKAGYPIRALRGAEGPWPQRIGVPLAVAGAAGLGYGAYRGMQPAEQPMMPAEDPAMKSAANVVAYANAMKAASDPAPAAPEAPQPGMLRRGLNAYDRFAGAHPRTVPAAAAALGAGGLAAAQYIAHQRQLAAQAAAADEGLAAPPNEVLHSMKAAALTEAANAGQLFALRQLGLA